VLIAFGIDLFGRIDETPGGPYVATEFWHISGVPIVPMRTLVVVSRRGNRWEGVPCQRLDRRSVLMAYARAGLVMLTGLVAVLGIFSLLWVPGEGGEDFATPGLICLGVAVVLLAATVVVVRTWRQATPVRQTEILRRLNNRATAPNDGAASPSPGSLASADSATLCRIRFFGHFERSYRMVLATYGVTMAAIFAFLPAVSPFCRQEPAYCIGAAVFFFLVATVGLSGLTRKGLWPSRQPTGGQWQPHERVRHAWPLLAVLVPTAFPLLTAITAANLLALRSGKRVMMQAFIADLYHAAGFWPTLLAVPLVGLLILLAVLLRVRRNV
jgi:hypothetical protein